jgi:aspartate/methionine/tyrosine aminotransferase
MHWAKTRSQARFNLATSGVGSFPLTGLKADLNTLEINGENSYGYKPLVSAIARHCQADPDSVVEAAGTSMANHLAMAAILEPGDEVLIEHPTYGLLLDVARYLRADVKRFHRLEENGWAIDAEEIAQLVSKRTKLIVLTNLHNPTSVETPDSVLRAMGDMAASVGAHLLVDEAYRESVYDGVAQTSFHLGPNFVVTKSLTKSYGLSGLRCGWILAAPDLAWKMRLLNDLFGATPVHVGELLSVAAFNQLPPIRERARSAVEADHKSLDRFFSEQPGLAVISTPSGTTSFPRLRTKGSERFIERLRTDFETSVVPGRFFEMPAHFRIGMGVNHEMFAEGLRRLGLALANEPS